MALKIIRNDITKMKTEAIVNTANSHIAVGAGCDIAVYKAAGYAKLLSWRTEHIGFVPEGEVFITPGFDLEAEYIIHAVSPAYAGGAEGEEEKLRSCYRKSLQLAKEYGVRSIAFPLISTGSFGYPKEEGMRIAVDEISSFLRHNDMLIYLTVFDRKSTEIGRAVCRGLDEYIDSHYVCLQTSREYNYDVHSEAPSSPDFSDRISSPGDEPPETAPKSSDTVNPMEYIMGSARPVRPARPAGSSRSAESSRTARSSSPAGSSGSSGSSISSLFSNRRRAPRFPEPVVRHKSSAPEFSAVTEMEDSCCLDESLEDGLKARFEHAADTFSQYLMLLIRNKKMENSEVYKRAIVDRKVFSKIKNNSDYHPQKLTALCLCIGAKLNLDESKDLLSRAGYALSPCDKTDIIFSYFIENEIYDMIELDIQLEEHGLPCIIT